MYLNVRLIFLFYERENRIYGSECNENKKRWSCDTGSEIDNDEEYKLVYAVHIPARP